MSQGSIGAGDGMRVQLDALIAFGQQMQNQYDVLLHYGAGLADLSQALTDPQVLGDFPEARMLVQRHRDATGDIAEVLQEVRDGMDFAARVTRWVANQYAANDQAGADAVASVGTPGSTGVPTGVPQYGTVPQYGVVS